MASAGFSSASVNRSCVADPVEPVNQVKIRAIRRSYRTSKSRAELEVGVKSISFTCPIEEERW